MQSRDLNLGLLPLEKNGWILEEFDVVMTWGSRILALCWDHSLISSWVSDGDVLTGSYGE